MTTVAEAKIGKGWGEEAVIVTRSPFFTKVQNTELLESTRYDKFIKDEKNRPIHAEKVNFFMRQFKEGNFFMKEFPVIVDKNFVILDGQHRYEAVRLLQFPLYFRFADTLTIDNVVEVQLNAGWKITDYIHAYIKQKKQDYVVLQRFMSRYKISAGIAVSLLTQTDRGGLKRSGFYEGAFKVKDEAEAHKNAKAINEIGEIALRLNRDASFCSAVIKIINHPEYDHKRMIEQLTKYVSLMRRHMKIEDYIRNLEEIYNYRLYTKNKVRFI